MCLSVCLSLTSRCSTETAKRRTTQTTPHISPWTLVFWSRKSRQNSNGVTPNGGAKYRWGRLNTGAVAQKLATFDAKRCQLSSVVSRKFITLSVHLICLQHVRRDAARRAFVSDSWSLYWLRVAERIIFRSAVLTYRCLHGSAPEYLSKRLQRVSDVGTRLRLRSSSTNALVIYRTSHATVGDRSPYAAAELRAGSHPFFLIDGAV